MARVSANPYRAPYVRRGSLERSSAIAGSACVGWSMGRRTPQQVVDIAVSRGGGGALRLGGAAGDTLRR
jgi:hypothetical protein